MNNLLFVIYLIFIIIISIIIITYFFITFIKIPDNNLVNYQKPKKKKKIIKTIPNLKRFFKRNSKLKGCRGQRCINGGYCFNCQGPNATCCCFDAQCLN